MPKRKGTLSVEHALLGFLQESPLHAYEIHQRLQDSRSLGSVWRLKQAHLYALIDRLEMEGLVKAELVPQEARPAKRLLHLTDAGRTAFVRWISTPVEHGRDLRIEFLAKLFWAQHKANDIAIELITQQRATCEGWLHDLYARHDTHTESDPFAALVLQFRIGQTEAMLCWLDTCATWLAHERSDLRSTML